MRTGRKATLTMSSDERANLLAITLSRSLPAALTLRTKIVPCVDEKSQIQALERTQLMLPMGFGYIEGVTHDY